MTDKRRVDTLLVERGLAESRARAQALVLAGLVWSAGQRLDKPGTSLATDTPLEVRGREHPWVSRGGIKLAHALDHFAVDPAGAVALDIGASTGGFTDVLLAPRVSSRSSSRNSKSARARSARAAWCAIPRSIATCASASPPGSRRSRAGAWKA